MTIPYQRPALPKEGLPFMEDLIRRLYHQGYSIADEVDLLPLDEALQLVYSFFEERK
jgi:hypothetical protein